MKNKLIWWKFFFLDYLMVFWLLLVRNKKSTLDSIQFNWIHLNLKLHNLKKFITTKHDKGVCFKRKLCNGTMHLSKPKSNMLMGKTLMKKNFEKFWVPEHTNQRYVWTTHQNVSQQTINLRTHESSYKTSVRVPVTVNWSWIKIFPTSTLKIENFVSKQVLRLLLCQNLASIRFWKFSKVSLPFHSFRFNLWTEGCLIVGRSKE